MNENNQPQYEHDELTRTVEPEVIRMGVASRIISIFVSPGELMRNVKVYPTVLVPYLLAVVLGIITIFPTTALSEMILQEMSIISIERYGVDFFDVSALADIYGDTQATVSVDAVTMATNIAGALFMPLIISFFAALGLFIMSKICKGQSRLGQLFSMYMHVYVIMAVGTLVVAFLMTMTGTYLDITSLAALAMPQGRIDSVAFIILSSINIFNIWATLVTVIGLKIINEFSMIKAVVITIIAFLFSLLIAVVFTMMAWWMLDMTSGMVM